MFLIFLPALRNPTGPPCEAAQLVFSGRCLFSVVIRISRLAILSVGWTLLATGRSHFMAYWSKITVLFAGPQKHQCSIFMVINICYFLFSNLLWLSVENSELSELGKCIFRFGQFLRVHLKFNFSIDFFQSGIKKLPKRGFCISEYEMNNWFWAGRPDLFAVLPANQILRRIRRIW